MNIGRRTWLRVLLPLLAALAAVFVFLAVTKVPTPPHRLVVVTTAALPAGTVLTSADLTLTPTSEVSTGDLSSVAQAVGQSLTVPLSAGERVRQEDVVPPLAAALVEALPVGERALTLSLTPVQAVGFQLAPGNRVDILATFGASSGPAGAPLSDLVLSNILLLRVAPPATGATSGLVTLEVKPSQAALLELSEQVGSITLILRPARDRSPATALQEVTQLP